MTDRQITIYLSVGGASEEDIFRRVTELLKNMGHEVIGRHWAWSAVPQPEVFETSVKERIRRCSVFIGILGGDNDQREQTDSVAVETGPSATEIEYFAAATLAVPQLLYVRQSVLDSNKLPFTLSPDAPKPHFERGFIYDEELLKWLPEDLGLITRQQQEASAERRPELGGNNSKTTELGAGEEGYNENFEAMRDQVAPLNQPEGKIYAFGPFFLDTRTRSLLRDGQLLPLRPRAYGVLLKLVENNTRLITRDELMDSVWGPDLHVAPNALDHQISQLRSALDDQASNPEYIRTIPRQGFQFIATARVLRRFEEPGETVIGTFEAPSMPAEGGAASSAEALPPVEPSFPSPYPPETLQAFAVAEALRRRLDHLLISRTNVLFGLMAADTGLAGLVMNRLGISRDAVLELIGRRLSRNSKRALDLADLLETAESIAKLIDERSLAQFPFSDNLRTALKSAESLTLETSPVGLLWPDYIFVSLMRSLEDDPGFIGWMLGKEKREWIQKTFADWLGDAFTEEGLRDKAITAGLYSPPSASSDAASKDDLLNFKQSAQAMVNIVLKQETVPPLVIGVYGPWGSGKSTYLELVKKSLLSQYDEMKKRSERSKAVNLLVVDYDAWAYSDAPKLWAGLITKIARKLDEDLGFWGRIKYLLKTHRARLMSGLLLGLIPLALAIFAGVFGLLKPLAAGLVSAAASLISVASAWLAQRQAVFGNVRSLASKFDSAPASGVINSIQDEFRDALESWIKQKTGTDAADATIEQRVRDNNLKIVVFIDELDRCPLERIVDILEAIKLFLAKEIFIVFMAVDTRVASEAIRLHYKDVRNPDLPREYLEKIVQLPLRVPTAKGKFLGDYLRKFMPSVKDDEASDGQAEPSIVATPISAPASPASTGEGAAAIASAPSPTTKSIAQPVVKPAAPARKFTPREFADPSPTFSLPQLPDTTTELKMLKTISERFLESNPRRIKRLLNTYRYVKVLCHSHSEPVQTDEWQKTMLGWLTFTMTWPAFMAKAIDRVADLEPQADSYLLRALEKIPGHDSRPTREDIKFILTSTARGSNHFGSWRETS
jgi:DNA-binding winged helix-turn-helix (wHTH) protein